MEIYEKGVQITMPSFIFYISPSKKLFFKPFVTYARLYRHQSGATSSAILSYKNSPNTAEYILPC
jgi:hypothetical protein